MSNSAASEKEVSSGHQGMMKPAAQVESYGADEEKAAGTGTATAMGYEQELKRNLSMLTILGLGAAIIAAPFGLSTSASFALINGE
jgi:hypothetical protein